MPFGLRADEDVIEDQKRSLDAAAVHYERRKREIETLQAENLRLRAALKPFAEISLWRDTYPDAAVDTLTAYQMQGYVKVEDVRAARSALTPDREA